MREQKEINWFIENGFSVLAPDLPGIGELGSGALKGDAYINNISYNMWFMSMLIGRSILGVQVSDVIKLAHVLKQKNSKNHVYGIAREEMSPILLHAAAFDPVVSKIALIKPYWSYESIVKNRFYNSEFVYSIVPGALLEYDLPDLAATLAPRSIVIAGTTDSEGKYINNRMVTKNYAVIREAYDHQKVKNELEFLSADSVTDPEQIFGNWKD